MAERVSDEDLELIRARAWGKGTVRIPAQLAIDLTREVLHLRAVRDAAAALEPAYRKRYHVPLTENLVGYEALAEALFALLAAQAEEKGP